MSNDEKWQDTGSAKVGCESFHPKRHLRSDKWEAGAYPSIADYMTLEVQQMDGASFQPTKLFHVTNYVGFQGIRADRAFKSETAKTIGTVDACFSWWSFEIDQGEKERERNRYREIIYKNLNMKETLLSEFFNSPAFQDESRYGNFKLTYDIQTLIETYKSSVCDGQQPEFRVLGTFRYKQEIMHAVVVHPPDVSLFQDYPAVPNGPESDAVVSVSDQGWKWRPESTGNQLTYRRWDHVSFAFYLPPEKQQFKLPDGELPLTYCKIGKPDLSGSDPVSEEEFYRLTRESDQTKFVKSFGKLAL
uniref:uncharacterized protein n=1 Tax=Pristiophorus japonicus TaxID=55135 RepID=UPI00398EEE7B